MRVRGAPAIGIAGAYGVVLASFEPRSFSREARRLREARPTAVNLAWAVDRMLRRAEREGAEPGQLLEEAQAIHEEDRLACEAIGRAGQEALADRVLTHCNAGALATGGIGTALAPIYVARAAGRDVQVYATETRPLLQGARLTAWELSRAGVPVTLVADGAVAGLLASGRVGAVLVGADRVAANGDTANKIGTYAIALAAARHGVPFYVAAPASTFDLSTPAGDRIRIEERSPDEVRTAGGRRTAPARVAAWNPAFDVTPHELIAGFVTDRGLLRPPFETSLGGAFGGRTLGPPRLP
jgi:methylthioribose-1-phosphate isomerase